MNEDDVPLPPLDLRLTAENLDDIYERAPCGYCSCLPDGTLVKINQTLLGWLGYEREQMVAQRCLQELFTIGGRLHYETYCAPLLLLQGEVREISYQLRRRDGSSLPVLLYAVLVRDEQAQPLVIRVTLFDITERRKYEQELLRAKIEAESQREQLAQVNQQLTVKNDQLTRINAELDSFVYTASHDLKQPASNMLGLLSELKRTTTFQGTEASGMVAMFEEALHQIMGTVEELTEAVQLQRQIEHVPTERINLQPFTEEIIRSLEQPLYEPTAEFELDFVALPTMLVARPSLHSMLYNLLGNAIKYAQPGRRPRIAIRTKLADGMPVLSVQDNGRGIDLERHWQDLFQLFRRFHPEVVGSGMGLYLVNRLVLQAGGRMEVDSVVGEGSTFYIFLPAGSASVSHEGPK